jgi:hypothetical protein
MITEIEREHWKRFLDLLSRDLDGWETRVEIFNDEIGAQVSSTGLPFHGLTAETKADGTLKIEVLVGDRIESHQTHTVENPVRMSVERDRVGPGGLLGIEDADGTKMLIKFIQPFPVVVEYVNTDMVSVSNQEVSV